MDTSSRDEPFANEPVREPDAESTRGASKPRRRKRKRAKLGAASPRDVGAAVRAAFTALDDAARALARARGLAGSFRGVEVKLRLANGQPPERLSGDFLRELLSRLDEARAAEDFVVPNRAYCLRCESFLCAHASPRDPREVMAGYEPTGRPVWADFLSIVFDRRDARSESVADRSAGVVTIISQGPDLTRDRIAAFGGERPEVEVLCQVAAGLFPLTADGGDEAAVTVQVLKVKTPGGPRLVVQPIGDPRLLGPASSSGDHDLQRILASARALAAERSRGASADAALVKLATTLTNDLARDLQHCFHVRSRRTLHARERAAIGVRPTSHAFPEARTAADADIRVDGAAGTFVLLGKNSRVHFFNREGRHVTSVRFQGEAIRARLDSGRWRPAEAAEIAQFRQRVAGGGPTLDR